MDRLWKKKLQSIETELQRWARKNKLIQPGEKFLISIDRKKIPTVEVSLKKRYRQKPAELPTTPFTDQDWEKILTLDWQEKHREMLEKIKENNNNPTEVKSKALTFRGEGYAENNAFWFDRARIEMKEVFRKAGLPYRLIKPFRKNFKKQPREEVQLGVVKDQ